MKRMILNKKQKEEMARITKFFLESTEILEPDKHLRAAVDVKLLSRLACFTDLFTGHLNKKRKHNKKAIGDLFV